MLADLVDGLQRRGVALVLVGLAPSVRQVLSKAGLLDRIVVGSRVGHARGILAGGFRQRHRESDLTSG
jgi:anti-anti-sigma regulatory factor